MSQKNKVSVIIPVYNGEQYLEETVKSILDSKYPSLEILLIDDGSKDSSPGICKKLCAVHKNIYYFCKSNGGIAEARNYGLERATGEYVCFVDQDDLIEPRMYSSMTGRIQKTDSDICLCGTAKYSQGNLVEYESFNNEVLEKSAIYNRLFLTMLYSCYHIPSFPNLDRTFPSIWKGLFRRDFLENNHLRFIKLIDYEDDYTFLAEAYLSAERVVTISEQFYYWRVNLNSESYSFKYISDLNSKYKCFYNYYIELLNIKGVPKKEIENWQTLVATQYLVDNVENIVSHNNPANIREKIHCLTNIQKEYNEIKKRVSIAKLRKGVIRKRVILELLKYHIIPMALVSTNIMNVIGSKYQKNKLLLLLEKEFKK